MNRPKARCNTIYEESLCKGRSHSREGGNPDKRLGHLDCAPVAQVVHPDVVPLRFMNLPTVDLAPLRSISTTGMTFGPRACALVWGRE